MIKTAVVGVGAMGRHHARVYSTLPDVELVGVADINEEAAKDIADKYDTRAYTDYRQLILKERPDAISIATPTVFHKEVALLALDCGIHLLIEKPIAHSVSSAKEIVTKAHEKGVKLMVGHIERFNPVICELAKVLESNILGDIVAMSAKRVGPFTDRITDVGVIIDIGVHDIDIMSYLFNDTISGVYASAGDSGGLLETYAMMMLKFNGGGTGIIETNRLTPRKIRQLTVTGTKGVAIADYLKQTLDIHNGINYQPDIDNTEPLVNELSHFIECVREDKAPLINGLEGIHALEVALSAISSYQNNRFIDVREKSHSKSARPGARIEGIPY
ncbi:Gfo/Idh/MocA family oxidoreductase [Candidatus Altiarchaeota archaeon]